MPTTTNIGNMPETIERRILHTKTELILEDYNLYIGTRNRLEEMVHSLSIYPTKKRMILELMQMCENLLGRAVITTCVEGGTEIAKKMMKVVEEET